MKKLLNYVLFSFVLLFGIIFNVNAECSYQERKDLLNKAKNVDIFYEVEKEVITETGINTYGEEVSLSRNEYSFVFNVVGLTDDLFIKYYNLNDGEEKYINYSNLNSDKIYTFQDNNYNYIYTYYFEIYSANDKCVGQKMYKKKVVKPMFNGYSQYSICQEEGMDSFKYCKSFVTKKINLTESEFNNAAKKYLNESIDNNVEQDSSIINFLKNNYIYIIIFVVVVIFITVLFIVRKKRSRL